MADRSPHDGEPFYCAICGAGYGEFVACDWPHCQLENADKAMARKDAKDAMQTARNKSSG